jgi:hypothetical protein
MSIKQILPFRLWVLLFLIVVSVGLLQADSAYAVRHVRQAEGITIPYTGRLSIDAGMSPPEDAYTFEFSLYNVALGGGALWSEVQEGVRVKNGAFSTELGSVIPIPQDALDDNSHWLAVAVRGPSESEFTTLNPRQRMDATAPDNPQVSTQIGGACPHDHFGEAWIGETSDSGLYIGNTDGTGGAGVVASSSSGPALVIETGSLQVKDAGLGSNTPVFVHQVFTSGSDANLCTKGTWDQYYSTVIDHPLTNGNQDAILFVTPNYGLASSEHVGPAQAPYGVYYDDRNQCGFGADRWVIYAFDSTTLNDGQMFNVLVVLP